MGASGNLNTKNNLLESETMQRDDLFGNLICPDCRGKILASSDKQLSCADCGRIFPIGKVIDMLPSAMKRNYEDDAWKILPYEGAAKPAWMALLHKKDRVLYFYEEILPKFDFAGKVLEVGAGTSWASALIKKKYPQNLVVATDISPYALERGVEVVKLLDSSVDFHIACNAERMPFADGYFDVVISNATIHHFPDPQQGVREIWRVLKRGGRSCALGEVAAGALFKSILTSRVGPAGKRARSFEVEEKVYSLNTWTRFFSASGFKDIKVSFDKTWQHKLYDWFTVLYYRFASTVPNIFLGNFLPCNVDIYATKP